MEKEKCDEEPILKRENLYKTANLYEATAVTQITETPPEFEQAEDGKTLFCYPLNEVLLKALTAYNAGVQANIKQYVLILLKLKAEMLTRRSEYIKKQGGRINA